MAEISSKLPKQEPHQITATPDKIVPKFCTGIEFIVINNKYMAITMTYAEPNNTPVMIERVMVDLEHAKQLSNVLKDILEKVDVGTTPRDK